jgi:hypothetical protein
MQIVVAVKVKQIFLLYYSISFLSLKVSFCSVEIILISLFSLLDPFSVYIACEPFTRLRHMSLHRCNTHSNYRARLPDFPMTQSKKFHVGQQRTHCVLLLSIELKARSCVRVRHLFWMKTRWSCAYNKSSTELRPVIQEFLYYSLWNKR